MTESVAQDTAAPPPRASFWEDVIDIFVSPVQVFRRRENASPWAPFLFVVIALAVIGFATFNVIEPALAGEMRRAMTRAAASNPRLTPELIDQSVKMQTNIAKYTGGFIFAITLLLLGLAVWLVGKLFGSKQTFPMAMTVASYAYFPRVLGAVVLGIQGLIMDTSGVTSMSPAQRSSIWTLAKTGKVLVSIA